MNWFIFTLVAVVSRAAYSIGTKTLSRDIHVSPQAQSFILTIIIGLMSIIASPLLGGINFNGTIQHIIPLLLIVLSSALGNILFFKGQKSLDASTTQIAFSSILIWGVILSVFFLGSIFSLIQLVGILLMLFAILFVQGRKNKFAWNSSTLNIIGSAFLFAIFQVASASVSNAISTGTYLVLNMFGTALVILILFYKDIITEIYNIRTQIGRTFMKTLLASSTSLSYNIFAYLAYGSAPNRGVVVVLLTAQVVLSVIFGILFLKEKENIPRKLVAGSLAFLAGILIKS